MKKTITSLGAMLFAIAGIAQTTGSLTPASGNFYPDDATYQGKIEVMYTDAVTTTDASVVITSNGTSYTLTPEYVYDSGFMLTVPELPDGAFTLTISGITGATGAVANVVGDYTYKSTFPLTGVVPAIGDTLTSKTATAVLSFNQNITYTSIVITSGNVSTTLPGSTTATNSVSVALLDSYWGSPSAGYNYINISLKGVKDADGTAISNASGSIGTIMTYYTIADATTTVAFLGTEPDPDWTYAEDLMGWEVTFKYSDTVIITNATAVINYLSEGEDIADPVYIPAADIFGMYNPRGGYYGLFIPVPAAPTYDPGTTLAYMKITVQGLTYNGSDVAPQAILFEHDPNLDITTFHAPATRGAGDDGATDIRSEKVEANNMMVNIYSAQGILIKKNVPASTVNELGKGLYIVGKKKVLVK